MVRKSKENLHAQLHDPDAGKQQHLGLAAARRAAEAVTGLLRLGRGGARLPGCPALTHGESIELREVGH
jgi:hypothetical protein